MANEFNIGTFNAPNAAVNLGGQLSGDQIGTQHQHATDPTLQQAIVELKAMVRQLQTQHPSVVTETDALAILDAEFREVPPASTRWITLRQQFFNPERHFQAAKATVSEVAKHYLEESVWSKAVITYADKLSEEPNHGA